MDIHNVVSYSRKGNGVIHHIIINNLSELIIMQRNNPAIKTDILSLFIFSFLYNNPNKLHLSEAEITIDLLYSYFASEEITDVKLPLSKKQCYDNSEKLFDSLISALAIPGAEDMEFNFHFDKKFPRHSSLEVVITKHHPESTLLESRVRLQYSNLM